MAAIFPSLISANLLNLKQDIAILDSYVDGYHLDIMDFHFVPNLTWGPDFINAIRKTTEKPLFIHLMVEFPEKYFNRMKLHDRDIVAIHFESPSTLDLSALLTQIKLKGWVPSIALNPDTPLNKVYSLQGFFNNILLMSVNPGFSGQSFIPLTIDKLKNLAAWRLSNALSFSIGIDGGVSEANCKILIQNGADQLVMASAIFDHDNPVKALIEIKKKFK